MSQGSIVTSTEFRKAQIASDSEDILVWLIEITHPNLTEPIRAASDWNKAMGLHEESKEPIYGFVSNGKTWYNIPFQIKLPTQPQGKETPQASLRVDNLSQEYTKTIRTVDTCPVVAMYMVLHSLPDKIQESFANFKLTGTTLNITSIEGRLSPADFRAEAFPSMNMTPATCPGAF